MIAQKRYFDNFKGVLHCAGSTRFQNQKNLLPMTFENLHKDIKAKDCNCLKFGSPPNASDAFFRWGVTDPATIEDFKSHNELGIPLKGKGCSAECHHNGVSLFQIRIDLEKRKAQLKRSYHFSPTPDAKIAYFLHVKNEAGLIWYPQEKNHCELFKADKFSLDRLEFVDVFDM